MKKIFIFWIAWQLIVIGLAYGEAWNTIADGTYDCHTKIEHIASWKFATIPLIAFLPNQDIDKDYCANK